MALDFISPFSSPCGEEIVISERRVVTFKPSPELRKVLNKTEESELESAFQK